MTAIQIAPGKIVRIEAIGAVEHERQVVTGGDEVIRWRIVVVSTSGATLAAWSAEVPAANQQQVIEADAIYKSTIDQLLTFA